MIPEELKSLLEIPVRQALLRKAIEEEREACAKLAESFNITVRETDLDGIEIAAAIRARGVK